MSIKTESYSRDDLNLYNFDDPENKEDKDRIFSIISNIKSPEEAFLFAENISNQSESWIVDEIKEFADEYSQLDGNWDNICSQTGQTKKSILIVKKVAFSKDMNYTIIKSICEILTRCGWCVRGEEFIRCLECNKAVFRLHKEKCINCEKFVD